VVYGLTKFSTSMINYFFGIFVPIYIQLAQQTAMVTSLAKKATDTNRGKVALFVTNKVSLHDHKPQKIDGKTEHLTDSQP